MAQSAKLRAGLAGRQQAGPGAAEFDQAVRGVIATSLHPIEALAME